MTSAQDNFASDTSNDGSDVIPLVGAENPSEHQDVVPHGRSVSALPPELLSQVFLSWRDLMPAKDEFLVQDQSWMTALRVSHLWRAVALSCPALWCRIFVGPERYRMFERAELMVQRSQDCLLSIDIEFGDHSLVDCLHDTLKLLLGQLYRTRHLLLRGVHLFDLRLLQSELTSPAPALQSFLIREIGYSGAELGDRYRLPERLFGGAAPHLRLLLALDCFLWTPLPFFDTLTTLHIRSSSIKLPLGQLVLALKLMIRLESLTLKRFRLSDVEADAIAPIILPSLRFLSLDTFPQSLKPILTHISTPRLDSLIVDTILCSDDDTNQLALLISQVFPSTAEHYIPSYALRIPPPKFPGYLAFQIWNTAEHGPPLFLRLTLGFRDRLPAMAPVLAALPVSRIVEADIASQVSAFRLFEQLLSSALSLQRLRVEHGSRFPEQILEECEMGSWDTLVVGVSGAPLRQSWLESLADTLRTRADGGYRLPEVRIAGIKEDQDGTDTLLASLRAVVPVALVDEIAERALRWSGRDRSAAAVLDSLMEGA